MKEDFQLFVDIWQKQNPIWLVIGCLERVHFHFVCSNSGVHGRLRLSRISQKILGYGQKNFYNDDFQPHVFNVKNQLPTYQNCNQHFSPTSMQPFFEQLLNNLSLGRKLEKFKNWARWIQVTWNEFRKSYFVSFVFNLWSFFF